MADAIQMLSCPFCEGPPVAFNTTRRCDWKEFAEDGDMVDAYVFCHECGAQGPSYAGLAFDQEDVYQLQTKVVEAWNKRDSRHRSLFDSGNREQLNLFPRPDGYGPQPAGPVPT